MEEKKRVLQIKKQIEFIYCCYCLRCQRHRNSLLLKGWSLLSFDKRMQFSFCIQMCDYGKDEAFFWHHSQITFWWFCFGDLVMSRSFLIVNCVVFFVFYFTYQLALWILMREIWILVHSTITSYLFPSEREINKLVIRSSKKLLTLKSRE